MKVWGRGGALAFAAALLTAILIAVPSGSAQTNDNIAYGVSVAKGCHSPTFVGQPYTCFYIFTNITATGVGQVPSTDDVLVTGIHDLVTSGTGPVLSSDLLPQLSLVASSMVPPAVKPATCTGPGMTGNGTQASPWVGATSCLLPYGTTISSMDFSWYTVKPTDYFNLTNHKLTDQADYTWFDQCNNTPSPDTCDKATRNDNQAPSSTIVKPFTPTINTVIQPSGPLTIGSSAHDTATITYDQAPPTVSGTVTYALYDNSTCSGTPVDLTPVNNAYTGGTVPNSKDFTFLNAGTFYFVATFSGDQADGVVGPVSSGCSAEPITVTPNTPSLTTQASLPTVVPASLTDVATLTGGSAQLAGTITYHLFSDSNCTKEVTGSPVTKSVSGNGSYTSPAISVTVAGTYYWRDQFDVANTDTNDTSVGLTACGAANESTLVQPTTPALKTVASPATATLPVTGGVALSDTATLSGATADATGTITFNLYSDSNCTTAVAGSPVTKSVSGNGDYTSPAITVSTAGTYYWRDSYSGDGNNSGVALTACGAANESSVISPRTPTIATVIQPTGPITVGASANDTSTLSNETSTAGGTVTYTLYTDAVCGVMAPNGNLGTKTVTNGVVPPSNSYTFNTAGTFYFVASYSGDANNNPATSACSAEQLVVQQKTPTITTVIVPAGPVAIGSTAHDTAALHNATADAGGHVNYALFTNPTCTGTGTDLTPANNTVVNGAVPNSADFMFTSAGTYYFVATYSGDNNNAGPVNSGCAAEPFVVLKNSPIVNTIIAAGTQLLVGGTTHDTATLTGATANAGGTIDYTLYNNPNCTGPGTDLGPGAPNNVVVNGNVPNSNDFTFHAAGTFYFVATYSGDSNNAAATSGCAAEALLVTKAQPAVNTVIVPAGPLNIGQTAHDTAQLQNATPDAGGTIDYKLYNNPTCTGTGTDLGPGAPNNVVVNGAVPNSNDITFTSAGTFYFVATYSGDQNNAGPVSSSCNAEPIVIKQNTPSVSTTILVNGVAPTGPVAIGTTANDSATLAGATADAGGTISYALYSDSTCTTKVTDLGPGAPNNAVTNGSAPNSSPFTFTKAGTFYFVATYSGDPNNAGPVSSGCSAEPLVVKPNAPTITTLIVPGVTINVGDSANDTSTLINATSDAGGTVTYTLYTDAACTVVAPNGNLGTKTVTNHIVPPSDSYTFTTAGTYYFVASYSGDANNLPAVSNCADEQLVVKKATPSLVTQASAPVTLPVSGGVPLTDQAVLSGAFGNAGGTISFQLYSDASCATAVGSAVTAPVSGNGTYTSPAVTVNAAGTYYWRDTYSGDVNNASFGPTACGATNESTVVSPRTPSVTTVIANPGPLTPGQSTHDTAQLVGATANAGGTISYALYSSNDCTNLVANLTPAVPNNAVVNGNVPNSTDYTFPAPGTFYFVATYSGDGNNTGPVSSPCSAEQIVVGKMSPTITTLVSPPGPIAIGASAFDTATLHNATPDAGGTVTYTLYSDANCGTMLANLGTNLPVVNGAVPNSSPFTFTAAGTYYFVVSYSGDGKNNPAVSGCADEPLVVGPNKPALTTNATPNAAHAPADLADIAHLTGATANATGTITFHLYTDVQCQHEAAGSPVTVQVHGSGDYTSPTIHVSQSGAFNWVDTYSGDANNASVGLPLNLAIYPVGGCSAPNEEVAINAAHPALSTTANPTTSTAPAQLTDMASLTGATNDAGGTITFNLYSDSNCTNLVATRSASVAGSGFYSSGTPVTVSSAGTYYWSDSYSGDANNDPIAATQCGAQGETTTLTNGAKGQIEICKAPDNGAAGASFKFSGSNGNGASFGPITVVGGTCSSAITVATGRWTITEDLSSGLWKLAGVTVSPDSAYISENDGAGSVKVQITKNADTAVSFTNTPAPAVIKICKWSSTPQIQGNQFSFSLLNTTLQATAGSSQGSAGCSSLLTVQPGSRFNITENVPANEQVAGVTGGNSNVTINSVNGATANVTVQPGVNAVYYENEPVGPAQNGYIEICKDAGDQFVAATTTPFQFTITNNKSGASQTASVLPGQCTAAIQVPAGSYTVAEAATSGTQVTSITANPQSDLGLTNLNNGTAVVVVPVSATSAGEVQVHFTNSTIVTQLKVCKFLGPNSSALAGQTFTFTVTDDAYPAGTSFSVQVVATASANGACTIVGGSAKPTPFPVGSNVTVTENLTGQQNQFINGDNSGVGQNDSQTQPIKSGINEVDFTNQAFGQFEVCKNFPDSPHSAYDGLPFTFTYQGVDFPKVKGTLTVGVDACSQPQVVPVGNYTITETPSSGFSLQSVTATGPGGDSRVVSQSGSSVTISVPFFSSPFPAGGETDVTFVNGGQSGTVKVCKLVDNGSQAALSNNKTSFSFTLTNLTANPNQTIGTQSVTGPFASPDGTYPPGPSACTVFPPQPVVGTNGKPIKYQLQETTGANYSVSSIQVQNGTVLGQPNDHTVKFTMNPGQVVIFVTNTSANNTDG